MLEMLQIAVVAIVFVGRWSKEVLDHRQIDTFDEFTDRGGRFRGLQPSVYRFEMFIRQRLDGLFVWIRRTNRSKLLVNANPGLNSLPNLVLPISENPGSTAFLYGAPLHEPMVSQIGTHLNLCY